MIIDYQIQTTASDGKFSPRECVKMAKDNGVESIAITDHDTVGGVDEAIEAGVEFGVEVIPGVEISSTYQDKMIHILGFGIDHKDPILLGQMQESKNWRETRARLIVEELQKLGFHIDFEKVKARAAGVVARPHIAAEVLEDPANAAKLEREGLRTKQDIFDHYIGEGSRIKIPAERLTPEEAIHIIHDARGAAVWSHPCWPATSYKFVEETLRQFIKWGIDGLETFAYAPEDDVKFLHALAEKYKLLRTAGSDFHDLWSDVTRPEAGSMKIGGYPTYGFSTDGIREALLAAVEKRKRVV